MSKEYNDTNFMKASTLDIYLKDVRENTSRLPNEKINELCHIYKQTGDVVARKQVIEANLGLVLSFAKSFAPPGTNDYEDIVGSGNLGLMKAIELYNPDEGVAFSTYASYWIKQAIFQFLANNKTSIHFPIHVIFTIRKITRASEEFEIANERKPTIAELSEILGISEKKINDYREISVISLNDKFFSDEDEFGDFIEDESINIEDEVIQSIVKSQLPEMIYSILQGKDLEIIIKRFGFDGKGYKTLNAVAKDMGITGERARIIESRALRTLRSNLIFRKTFDSSSN